MKKNIIMLIAALTACSLTAYGFVTWKNSKACEKEVTCSKPATASAVASTNDFVSSLYKVKAPDLIYKVESRFMTRVTKEQVHNATSILDIYPKKVTENLKSHTNVTVGVLTEGDDITVMGVNEKLNPEQIELLQSTDYASNIFLRSYCKEEIYAGDWAPYNLIYYMTIVPENEAEYSGGQEGLVEYLRENSKKETIGITKEGLKPGRVNFTVAKDGTVEDVYLDSSSGYPAMDEKLIELVEDMPGTWTPATNAQGEAVDQGLVFFFGLMGC